MSIEVRELHQEMGGLLIFERLSLTVRAGESVALLGPSGCGKSTLLNTIAGILPPGRGEIWLGGEDWTGRSGRVSYMQQKDLLLPWRRILDNVCIPLELKGVSPSEARRLARPRLAEFGLQDFADYYPSQLSGGMRQRAALLRTILFADDLLLLDEPFAALDAITRRRMQLWLKELLHRHSQSLLLVTHDIDEALLMARRIYILSELPARVVAEISVAADSDPPMLWQQKQEILNLLNPADSAPI
ncbi:MAG: ATP-binding cassette domain-containing protein [Syntrophomonadaceae bacterium]|nr:ATP-binding cassette domain-containing protein [Syntrophomonadaceae bacterium]